MDDFIKIALIHFLGMISPGQDFIGIARYTLRNGASQAWKFALGIALGQAIYSALSIFGIIEVVLHFPIVNKIFMLLSGLYLLYLAFAIIKSHGDITIESNDVSQPNPIKMGFMVTISNPKAPIFYSSILAGFIDRTSSMQYLLFINVYIIFATFCIFWFVAWMFNIFRHKVLKYTYYVEKIFAICLMWFGIKLLLQTF